MQRPDDAETASIEEELLGLFRRLSISEAKWLIRMLLKNYSPIQVPEDVALRYFPFLPPALLRVQIYFEAAVNSLDGESIRQMPAQPAKDIEALLTASVSNDIRPQVGVMIAQPRREKARGIRHCCQLAGANQFSVERKHDGE